MTSDTFPAPTHLNGRRNAIRECLANKTRSFTELAQAVREAGLNNRTKGFYLLLSGSLVLALAAALTGFALLGESWFQLLIAGSLGVIFTQFAFLGHEASHRQVFTSGPANDKYGRILATAFVGISYAWWMNKHTRHHANPNKVGKDPDLAADVVVFLPEDAAARRGLGAFLTRYQGWLFFPLLPFFGLDLHASSFRGLLRKGRVDGRKLEIGLLTARFTLYFGAVFWLLPFGMACAFLGVQFAVFGIYMGTSFAPNHVGMPIVADDEKLDFLDKQVLTSRNVTGGWWVTALMGGLNYQIEHHLFPGMPRPNLKRAKQLVMQHCRDLGIQYTENSLPRALGIVVEHLNRVGLAARHSFNCPTAAQLGRR